MKKFPFTETMHLSYLIPLLVSCSSLVNIYHHAEYPNFILEEQLNLSQQKLAEETARAERLELLLKPDPLG